MWQLLALFKMGAADGRRNTVFYDFYKNPTFQICWNWKKNEQFLKILKLRLDQQLKLIAVEINVYLAVNYSEKNSAEIFPHWVKMLWQKLSSMNRTELNTGHLALLSHHFVKLYSADRALIASSVSYSKLEGYKVGSQPHILPSVWLKNDGIS